MWEWSTPDIFLEIIQDNLFFGDGSLITALRRIAANADGVPDVGAHQLFENVYLIQIGRWIIIYERMPEQMTLILSDMRYLSD